MPEFKLSEILKEEQEPQTFSISELLSEELPPLEPQFAPAESISIEKSAQVGAIVPPEFEGPSLTSVLGEAVSAPIKFAEGTIKALSPAFLPAHLLQADLMQRPDLQGTAYKMDLLSMRPKGEAALQDWPEPTEIRRRMQAVKQLQEFTLEDQLPEAQIQERVARITEEEEKAWFKITFPRFLSPAIKTIPGVRGRIGENLGRRIKDNEIAYLESKGFSEEARETVDRVREMNKESGALEEDPVSIVVSRGLPMAGLDLAAIALTDPLLAVGFVGKGALKFLRPLTFKDELRRVGSLNAVIREETRAAKTLAEIQRITPSKKLAKAAQRGELVPAGDVERAIARGIKKQGKEAAAQVGTAATKLRKSIGVPAAEEVGVPVTEGGKLLTPQQIARRIGEELFGEGPLATRVAEVAELEISGSRKGANARFAAMRRDPSVAAELGVEVGSPEHKALFKELRGDIFQPASRAGKFVRAPEPLRGIDPDIMADASRVGDVEAQIVGKTHESILSPTITEEIADELIGAVRAGTPNKPHFVSILKKRLPNISDGEAAKHAAELVRKTAPMRAFQRLVAADTELANITNIAKRAERLQELYAETLQNSAYAKAQAVEQLGRIVKEGTIPPDLEELYDPKAMQAWVEGLDTISREQKQIFRDLTGFRWTPIGLSRGGMFWLHALREPRNVLGGTGVWERIHNANADMILDKVELRDRVTNLLGGVVKNPELDKNLGMALYGKFVGKTKNGLHKYTYQVLDPKTKEVLKSTTVALSPEDARILNDVQGILGEFGDQLAQAGLRGVNKNTPIDQLFRIAYPFKRGAGRLKYHIPIELTDVVGTEIYFKHLLSPRVLKALVEEGHLPTITEAVERLIPGYLRRRYMHTAVKEADGLAKALPPDKARYWKRWKKVLLGQPGKVETTLNDAILAAQERVSSLMEAVTGKGLPPSAFQVNAATKIALGVSRALYRGILGGHLGSGLVNITQQINNAARFGTNRAIGSWTQFLTPEGRELARRAGLFEHFYAFFERPSPILGRFNTQKWDDILLSPMQMSEWGNRGTAFPVGVSKRAAELGLKNDAAILNASKETMREVLKTGMIAAEETQFIYGMMGTSPYLRNPLGQTAATLISFAPKQTEFLLRLAREDPTGLMRYFALSGFMTRMFKETMDIAADEMFGFGFIPENYRTLPLVSPQFGLMSDFTRYLLVEDPFEKARLQRRVFQGLENLALGAARLPILPIPKEVVGPVQTALGLPRRDVGARAAQGFMKVARMATTGRVSGKLGGKERTPTGKEIVTNLLSAGGLPTETQRRFGRLRRDVSKFERETGFEVTFDLPQRISQLIEEDPKRAFEVIESAVRNKVVQWKELESPGAFLNAVMRATAKRGLSFGTETLMRSPELTAAPEMEFGKRLQEFTQ